jgi:hypothetical protein
MLCPIRISVAPFKPHKLAGRRMVEQVLYFEDGDIVAVQSGHFTVLIDRGWRARGHLQYGRRD